MQAWYACACRRGTRARARARGARGGRLSSFLAARLRWQSDHAMSLKRLTPFLPRGGCNRLQACRARLRCRDAIVPGAPAQPHRRTARGPASRPPRATHPLPALSFVAQAARRRAVLSPSLVCLSVCVFVCLSVFCLSLSLSLSQRSVAVWRGPAPAHTFPLGHHSQLRPLRRVLPSLHGEHAVLFCFVLLCGLTNLQKLIPQCAAREG